MKKRVYHYNVSFFHKNGNGASQIIRRNKINSFADLLDVKNFIEKENDLKNVAIINFQLICKTRYCETVKEISNG